MIERDKEYYNQKISELYAVIENQEKIIRDLQEDYNNELDENLKLSELWLKSQEENKQLKEKVNQYENPEDMTLFYMWIDNKAKDKMKDLQQRINNAIKYIEKEMPYLQEIDEEYEDVNGNTYFTYKEYDGKDLLEILKGKE